MKNTSSNADAVYQRLEQIVKGKVFPRPVEFTTIQVEVSLDSIVFSSWFSENFYQANQTVEKTGGRIVGFSEEEYRRYLMTVLVSRVQYVNNQRPILRWNDGIMVPAFFAVCLAKIGRAVDDALGIQLIPTISFEDHEVMTLEEALSFSMRLRFIHRLGFTCADGYMRNKEGVFDAMSFFCTEDFVFSVTDRAPEALSVVASFLGVRGIETLLAPRVNYAVTSHLATLVRQLALPGSNSAEV
jgi:uncharacterized protein YeaC (DUF1315 family)